jgi:hypothetical protein
MMIPDQPIASEDPYYGYRCMTLEEFRGYVQRLAAGRAYTVALVTTETKQSDGTGIKTLSWHAWIDGHRSGINGDAHALLRWLYEGNAQGLELAIGPGMASVTVSDWSATTPPAKDGGLTGRESNCEGNISIATVPDHP